jgi:hypothetical protein
MQATRNNRKYCHSCRESAEASDFDHHSSDERLQQKSHPGSSATKEQAPWADHPATNAA